MWSVATSLITAGIRLCHPNQIVTLFNSIVVPKLLYGLELVTLTKSEADHLNTQARMCLKSLFGVSKRSRNLLNKLYNLPDITTLIDSRRLHRQIIHNKSVAPYIFHLLTTNTNIDFSYVHSTNRIINRESLNIYTLLLNKKYTFKTEVIEISDEIEECIYYIKNWHIFENRLSFRAKLEENIVWS